MSGHSKWASIKHKKAAVDAKRGKIFTKIIKEITVAARLGGGDAEANARLRLAVSNAKAANMPYDNVKRAIMKGTGELPGTIIEEIVYEGYGPGGTALYIEVMTDNKNRTVAELRHILSRHNGSMGGANTVAWKFEKKGVILVEKSKVDEDTLMTLVLDVGAEDMTIEEDSYQIKTSPSNFETVRKAIAENSIELTSAEITMLPNISVTVNEHEAEQLLKLIDALEEHEDIQNVYSDFDIPQNVLEKLSK